MSGGSKPCNPNYRNCVAGTIPYTFSYLHESLPPYKGAAQSMRTRTKKNAKQTQFKQPFQLRKPLQTKHLHKTTRLGTPKKQTQTNPIVEKMWISPLRSLNPLLANTYHPKGAQTNPILKGFSRAKNLHIPCELSPPTPNRPKGLIT